MVLTLWLETPVGVSAADLMHAVRFDAPHVRGDYRTLPALNEGPAQQCDQCWSRRARKDALLCLASAAMTPLLGLGVLRPCCCFGVVGCYWITLLSGGPAMTLFRSHWQLRSTIDVIYITILGFIFHCPKAIVELNYGNGS